MTHCVLSCFKKEGVIILFTIMHSVCAACVHSGGNQCQMLVIFTLLSHTEEEKKSLEVTNLTAAASRNAHSP